MTDRRGTVFVATSVVTCAVFTYRAIGDQRVATMIELPDDAKTLHEPRIICQGCAKTKREVDLALEKILFNE